MLVRTYRLTDKLGTVVAKSSTALTTATLDGVTLIVGGVRRTSLGTLGTIVRVLLAILTAIVRVIGVLLRQIWRLLRAILSLIGLVALVIVNGVLHLVGGTARTARTAATSGTTNAMARRAARAEIDRGLSEDPLRVQNRLLSGLVVVILAALIGVVLWATSPARTGAAVLTDLGSGNPNLLQASPIATAASAILFSTPIPTATEIPGVVNALGSIAYVVREKGQTDIWALDIQNPKPIRLTNDPTDDRDPAWSPNGKSLAFASHRDGNWEIYVEDIATGAVNRRTYDLSFQANPKWSPDGLWLTYESYQGNDLDIYVVPVDGSQPPQRLPANSDTPDFSPAWSPDGRQIAFVSWRDGNQDIYVFSLNSQEVYNLTNSPTRMEDYPAWSPDSKYIAYSAVDEGIEKVFVKPADNPQAEPQVIGRGRMPTWSPNGSSILFAVDSSDSTHLVASPFSGEGVTTAVIAIPLGAGSPTWSSAPLPPALVQSGGVGPAIPNPLYIEQESPTGTDPAYKLSDLIGVKAPSAYLSDRVNDSFNALRQQSLKDTGWDFLANLEDAFWAINRLPQPGEQRRNWHMTGRAFAINRNAIVGFPPPIEVVREDLDVYTYWRVYIRATDEAQSGQLGEPLRHMPWDFASRSQGGDVEAYNQGGRLRKQMPAGYYVDLTQLAADYGWDRIPAGSDWRANANSINYWEFEKQGGLDWYGAMREIYRESELGGFVPTPTPLPPTPGS